MSDGLISMTVLEVKNDSADHKQHWVRCRVNNHAVLGSTKGVNLPGVLVDLPAVTEKDVEDIKFGCEQGIDFVAASFTRTAENVRTIRALLKSLGRKGENVKIIAKIENQEGLDNFDAILAEADGACSVCLLALPWRCQLLLTGFCLSRSQASWLRAAIWAWRSRSSRWRWRRR